MILLGGLAAGSFLPRWTSAGERPVIGFLGATSQRQFAPFVDAYRNALAAAGFVEGRTVHTEYRWADGQLDRLEGLARELVDLKVAVIVASGGTVAAQAAKAATASVPIVFTGVGDAVGLGLVQSLGRPGGNATGVSVIADELNGKRLELLGELVPRERPIAIILNPRNPSTAIQSTLLAGVGRRLGRTVRVFEASNPPEIDTAFASAAAFGGLVVGSDPYFTGRRDQFVSNARRFRVPAIYQWQEFVQAGGLMSYGTNLAEAYVQSAGYVARILSGTNPSTLPVLQPTIFDTAINLRTASELGLPVPASVLFRATTVVE